MSPARIIGCDFYDRMRPPCKECWNLLELQTRCLSCYAAWSITENAAAAYLRICSDRVDPELQQNPYPDSCQGLPMSNRKYHDSDVELTRLRSEDSCVLCCTCHISYIHP